MTLSTVLFAGGASKRMGIDKATLSIHGEILWRRQAGILRQLSPRVAFVSAKTKPHWLPDDLVFVPDEEPWRGPLSGLAAVLKRLETSHLLALAMDLPQMTTEHLQKLLSLTCAGCGIVPGEPDFFEPLCAIYPVEAAAFTNEALESPDLSLQHFVRMLHRKKCVQIYPVSKSERPLYLNVNTPEDLPS